MAETMLREECTAWGPGRGSLKAVGPGLQDKPQSLSHPAFAWSVTVVWILFLFDQSLLWWVCHFLLWKGILFAFMVDPRLTTLNVYCKVLGEFSKATPHSTIGLHGQSVTNTSVALKFLVCFVPKQLPLPVRTHWNNEKEQKKQTEIMQKSRAWFLITRGIHVKGFHAPVVPISVSCSQSLHPLPLTPVISILNWAIFLRPSPMLTLCAQTSSYQGQGTNCLSRQ